MNTFSFTGLDGSNPLAFLAACGAHRLASLRWPEICPTLHWVRMGVWRPVLSGVPCANEQELCLELKNAPAAPTALLTRLGKNITVHPSEFGKFVSEVEHDELGAAFASAFGSEVCRDEKGDRIRYTDFCFITGSGHQDFLGTCVELQQKADDAKIHHALFESMDDADKGYSFRWNPTDARHYAKRWKNPGPEGAWTSWGANRLAFEALPLFPAQPTERRLRTTGFRRSKKWPEFTWPIWGTPLSVDELKSLLAWGELHKESIDPVKTHAVGILESYRSARIRIGKGANFKVSFLGARSV